MERFSSRPQRPANPNMHQRMPQGGQEDFSQMVDVTTRRPGFFGKLLVISLIVVSVAVTAFVGWMIVNNVGTNSNVDDGSYQAVFLSDGQIYFGKLSNTDRQYTTLEEIYYLQVKDNDSVQEAGTTAEQQITLVKLGKEIHGPKDEMFINTDQILFWENLKDDGQVATAIAKYKVEQASASEDTSTDLTADETTTDTTTE